MSNFCLFLSPSLSNQLIEEHQVNGRSQKRSTSSRAHADLVKWQGTPIRSPLLRLPIELSPLAIECFECILRYCGDLPPDPEQTEVKCVYTVLMVSAQAHIAQTAVCVCLLSTLRTLRNPFQFQI